MFKMLVGATVVVTLVGYGVITAQDIQKAGTRIVDSVNYLSQELEEAYND